MKETFPAKYAGQDVLDLEDVQNDYFRSHWGFASEEEVRAFREMLTHWGRRINGLTTEADCQGYRADEMRVREYAPAHAAALAHAGTD